MSIYRGVHDAVFDFHVSTQVALQVELAGAVRALEGLAASVEMHVAEEVVHSVKRLPAYLKDTSTKVSIAPCFIPARSRCERCHLLPPPCI